MQKKKEHGKLSSNRFGGKKKAAARRSSKLAHCMNILLLNIWIGKLSRFKKPKTSLQSKQIVGKKFRQYVNIQ